MGELPNFTEETEYNIEKLQSTSSFRFLFPPKPNLVHTLVSVAHSGIIWGLSVGYFQSYCLGYFPIQL
jgi:hypothetical protein